MKPLLLIESALLIILFLVTSCTTGACFEETEPEVVTYLYSYTTSAANTCDSVSVTAISETGDTLLCEETDVSSFGFVLDPAHSQSAVIIRINTETDTVTLNYTAYPHFISPECGYTMYSDLISVTTTHNIIKDITIDNKSVTLDGERNLRLFY